MTPFIIFLIIVTILALTAALGVLIYNKRWWPVVFVLCILVAFIVLAFYLPTRGTTDSDADADSVVATAVQALATGDTTILVPIYVIILALGIMGLIIVMVCGAIVASTITGSSGAVGALLLAFMFALVAAMPTIYLWYRVFIQGAVMLTLGVLFGSTALAGISAYMTRPLIASRRYGCQTVSHLLYYLSLLALSVSAANCDSVDNIFMLLAASVLSSACATLGIVVEGNAWIVG